MWTECWCRLYCNFVLEKSVVVGYFFAKLTSLEVRTKHGGSMYEGFHQQHAISREGTPWFFNSSAFVGVAVSSLRRK